jgi:hypothetical protein
MVELLIRYWAVAVPTYLCVAFIMIFIFYFGANMLLVPDIRDMRNLTGGYLYRGSSRILSEGFSFGYPMPNSLRAFLQLMLAPRLLPRKGLVHTICARASFSHFSVKNEWGGAHVSMA